MTDTRIIKIFRDFWRDRRRMFTVILAIALGIFCVGTVVTSLTLLDQSMNANYVSANPASAVLTVDHANDSLAGSVMAGGLVRDAELRGMLSAQVQVAPDLWQNAQLFIIDDFSDIRISAIYPDSGSWPAGRDEVLIEGMALPKTGKNVGDDIIVRTSSGTIRKLHIAGTVHDTNQAPAVTQDVVYGYISRDTLNDLNVSSAMNQLLITVANDGNNRSYIKSVAYGLKGRLAQEGYKVTGIDVPTPGKNPTRDTISELIFINETFAALAVILSMVLVFNMVSGLLGRQVKQIGMMKALGATTGQVMAIYIGGVFVPGAIATAIAVPASILAGRVWCSLIADNMLNFVPGDSAVPAWVIALMVGIGLFAPLVAAIYPVYRGCRITVKAAIDDYGIGKEKAGSGIFTGFFGRIPGLSRPQLLAIRNTFRRRERLALTLLTLAVGGGLFIAAMNMGTAVNATVDNSLSKARFGDYISLAGYYPSESVGKALADVPGVDRVEYGISTKASLALGDGTDSNRFTIVGIRPGNDMIGPPVIDGRWLQPGDGNAIILNQMLVRQLEEQGDARDIRAGDNVTLDLNGNLSTCYVAGITREMFASPRAWVNYSYLADKAHEPGMANYALLTVAADKSPAPKDPSRMFSMNGEPDLSDRVMPAIERAMSGSGIVVAQDESVNVWRQAMEAHVAIIAVFLGLMSILMVAVGILGLASTMSINIAERQREIGVMRAIGATRGAISGTIVIEALVIGLLSWILAVALAIPLSIIAGTEFGLIFFDSPLDVTFSPIGILLWLGIIVVLAPVASLVAARKASMLPVREVLAYE